VQFWDRYFKDHGISQSAEVVGRSGRKRCPCGQELIDIDNRVATVLVRLWRCLLAPWPLVYFLSETKELGPFLV
jgi:hypothetical protein